jgi:PAS domain S-box-containing protein
MIQKRKRRETRRILIVEDEAITALDLQNRLQRASYDVLSVATTGQEAIEQVADTCPDLVLMDIRLKGGMDGIAAAQAIRERFDVPIVYLTAHADGETVERAKLTEPQGYLVKPFGEEEVRTTIEIALHKHEMQKRLEESEAWLSTTLRSIGDAVIATDSGGRIKFVNPVAESLTGWKEEEALGQEATEVFVVVSRETRDLIENPITRALRENITVHLTEEVSLLARDGTEIPIDDSAAPIRDHAGNVAGAVLVFRDITERRRTEQALHRYAADLRDRNEELDAFAHTVAHDLKEPLAVMVGFAEVLEMDHRTMTEADMTSYLRMIVNSGSRMTNIVDELLLLSAVRRQDVITEALDMEAIVNRAQRRLAHLVEGQDAEISKPDTWPPTRGYAPWVEEVWVNYLSNAIKYGGRPPRVALGATELDCRVCFWVRDNGPGIPMHVQPQLFRPFTRLDGVHAKGHGLGLSIVQRIVEKLGGQVGVESNGLPGMGSTFHFTLPRL